jgi:uncharacterized membrane protein YdjX (TVP38/TMEM64 family)
MNDKRPSTFKALLFPLLIISIIAVSIIFRKPIFNLFHSQETIRTAIAGAGAAAPLVFILVQVIQVVIFVIPGEVAQIAGGYLFGAVPGTIYSVIGITIGSVMNFGLGRALGIPFIERLFGSENVKKFESIISSPRAMTGFFIFFVIPGIPKDILCYVAGISSMGFLSFFAISMLGRLPGIIGSTIIGSSAADKNWLLTGIIVAAAIVLFTLGSIFRDRIHGLVETIAGRKTGREKRVPHTKLTKNKKKEEKNGGERN